MTALALARTAATFARRRTHQPTTQPTPMEIAAARAAIYTTGFYAAHGLPSPIPVRRWTGRPDGTAEALLDDRTTVIHTPGQPLTNLAVRVQCPHGAHHTRPLHYPEALRAALTHANRCAGHQPDPLTSYGHRPTYRVLLPTPTTEP